MELCENALYLHQRILIKVYYMTRKEIIAIVKNAGTKEFKVTIGGESHIRRLFVSGEFLCEFIKGSRKYGRYLLDNDIALWDSVVPNIVEDLVVVKNFMNKVIKYLANSGLWSFIRRDYELILSQGDEFLDDLIKSSWTDQRDKLAKFATSVGLDKVSFHCDDIVYTARKGIKSVNYEPYSKDRDITAVDDAIRNRKEYSHKWRKGYDNSVSIGEHNGVLAGWYSEEYKDCGNGHYYLLIDARHAFFYEND